MSRSNSQGHCAIVYTQIMSMSIILIHTSYTIITVINKKYAPVSPDITVRNRTIMFIYPYLVWLWQLISVLLILSALHMLQNRSIMRGQNRSPLPESLQRIFRFLFLACMIGPLVYSLDSLIDTPIPVALTIALLYSITFIDLSEIKGGRAILWSRGCFLFKMFRKRFSVKLVKTTDLEPKQKYIFGIHPHGILPFGTMSALADDEPGNSFKSLFPGIEYRLLAASFCFYIPIYRDFFLGFGAVDAARFSAIRAFERGYSIALYPGGATEALYSDPTKDVLLLKKRSGFIKMALICGASLVPIFGFNENNTFHRFDTENPYVISLKQWFQRLFGLSLPLLRNIVPRSVPITVVVGSPIKVPKIDDPTDKDIQKYLNIYIQGITTLYNAHANKYNMSCVSGELEIA